MSSHPIGERLQNNSRPYRRSNENFDRATKKDFSDNLSDFSPSLKERLRHFGDSDEGISRHLKDRLRRESDMFFHPHPEWDNDPLLKRAEEGQDEWARRGFDDVRARHPMFRLPKWMSEEDDVSNLATRMAQAPNWPNIGRRGGPWRERKNSGSSAMSAGSEDDVDRAPQNTASGTSNRPDHVMHNIPIRIEAEAPPNCGQAPQQTTAPKTDPSSDQYIGKVPEGIEPHMTIRNQPQYASKTTSSVETTNQEEVPRDTRCSSAPPSGIPDQSQTNPQRYVSKINFTPQVSQEQTKKFNNVAKPFASPAQEKQATIPEESPEDSKNREQFYSQPTNPQTMQYGHPSSNQTCYEPQNYSQQPQNQPAPPQPFHQEQQPPLGWQLPRNAHNQYPQSYSHQPDPQMQQQPQAHFQQTQSQPHHQSSHQRGGVVRNIPIFFEGRNEPVPSARQQQENQRWQDQQHHQQMPQKNPPTGFNAGPHVYPQSQQFNYRQMPEHTMHNFPHEQQQYEGKQFQNCPQQPPAPPQHHTPHTQQHGPPSQESDRNNQHPVPEPIPKEKTTPKQPQKQEPPRDIKLETIAAVRESVSEYRARVDHFEGNIKNKEHVFLDEMLTRALLKLDNIDPDGRDDVRQARKALVKDINMTISLLETKISQTPDTQKENPDQPPINQSDQVGCNEPKEEIVSDEHVKDITEASTNTNEQKTDPEQMQTEQKDNSIEQTSNTDESQNKSENATDNTEAPTTTS